METISLKQAREILSDSEARQLMTTHRIEMGIDDTRTAVQYMAEVLLYIAASGTLEEDTPSHDRPPVAGDYTKDHVPYFA